MRDLFLYNTLSRKKEIFTSLKPHHATLYACGPTVYHWVHLGNLRTFIMVDLLKRVLLGQHYHVDHIMNITDVGHLTHEATDSGDDKLEQAAKQEGKSPQAIADFYTQAFIADLRALAIIPPSVMPKASEHVEDMIAMVTQLIQKGIAYETPQAVYFDVSQFAAYTALSGQSLDEKKLAARSEITIDPDKRNPQDFVVWFKATGKFVSHAQTWPSPWGIGFPGWHIKCSAMSRHYLGDTLDIHAGGVDMIGTHHTNEIAQSESVTNAPFVRYWFHTEHLLIREGKMARSEGTGIRLNDVTAKGIHPLAYRYLVYTAHYRSKMNFSWEALASASRTLRSLAELVAEDSKEAVDPEVKAKVWEALCDDLDTPRALAILHEAKSGALWKEFEFILGIDLTTLYPTKAETVPADVLALLAKRDKAREQKDWQQADELRDMLRAHGYSVLDTAGESRIAPLES